MKREILINQEAGEIRVAVLEDGRLVEIHVERPDSERFANNIYNARVENVLPGMQAAFVNIGLEKNAFLYVTDAVPAVNFDDLEGESAPKPRRGMAINKMLKNGQKVMVQVVKDPIGTKGARVSAYVTLPGHLVVLMPNVDYVGVSRRIADPKERQRLRQLAAKVKPRGMGLIVRTAAEGQKLEDLKGEVTYLQSLWRRIRSRTRSATAPRLLHKDLGLTGRVVRDLLNQNVTRVVTDSLDVHSQMRDLLQDTTPSMRDRLELFDPSKQDLFAAYGIEEDLERALQRRVWLKSGGYLVLDETEAFTVFDVNTGRYVGSTSLAQTVLDTNLEAATEIARQLRLRDIGGIIIIDFIDMDSPEHRQKVLACLEENLRRDRTRSHVLGLTQLGLVEMTRKKVRQSLGEMLTRSCPCCDGRGRVASEATTASRVRREMRRLLRKTDAEALLAEVHPSVAALLIGPGGSRVRELERETGKIIYIRGAPDQTFEGYKFRTFDSRSDIESASIPVRTGDVLNLRVESRHAANPGDGVARIEGFALDIEAAGGLVGERVKVEVSEVHPTYARARLIEPAAQGGVVNGPSREDKAFRRPQSAAAGGPPAGEKPPGGERTVPRGEQPKQPGKGRDQEGPAQDREDGTTGGAVDAATAPAAKRSRRSRSARRRRAAKSRTKQGNTARTENDEGAAQGPKSNDREQKPKAQTHGMKNGSKDGSKQDADREPAAGLREAAAAREDAGSGGGQNAQPDSKSPADTGHSKSHRRRGRRGRSAQRRKPAQTAEDKQTKNPGPHN